MGQYSEAISPLEATPYFLAVDQPPTVGEERKSRPMTQAAIVQGIVDEVCEHYDVPLVDAPDLPEADTDQPVDGELSALREAMALDLWVEPSAMMVDEAFASQSEPPGWWCREGLLANIRTVADEFCRERKLRAVRVLVAGPPASGKHTLAQAISDHFRIPHLTLKSQAIDEMVQLFSSNVCRYRGYVFDAGLVGFVEVEKMFRYDVEVPPPEPPDGDDQEPPPKQVERRLNEDLCPTFVIVTQAPDGLCRARWQSSGRGPIEEFQRQMLHYNSANVTDGVHSLADFFQDVANIGVFNLPVAGKDEEDVFESARIFLERAGRPFNYLPTEAEVAAEILNRLAEKESAAAVERAAAEAERHAGDDAGQREEMQRQEEQRALLELPLREYLMRYMIPSLTEGLIEVCKVLPENPVDYLATYIEEHAADAPALRT